MRVGVCRGRWSVRAKPATRLVARLHDHAMRARAYHEDGGQRHAQLRHAVPQRTMQVLPKDLQIEAGREGGREGGREVEKEGEGGGGGGQGSVAPLRDCSRLWWEACALGGKSETRREKGEGREEVRKRGREGGSE